MSRPSDLQAAAAGAKWAALSQALQQLASVVGTAVLARLLTTADFGLVSLASSVLAFAYVVLNVGLGATIVRATALPRATTDTLFAVGLGLGSLAAAVLLVLGPTLSRALGQPAAASYLQLLGPVVVLSMTSAVPGALLQRALRFRAYFLVQAAGTGVYVTVEILLASWGAGPLCVVYGQLAMGVVNLVGWCVAARYLPRPAFLPSVARAELRSAGGWLGVQGLSYASKNADYLLVSRFLGPAALGPYYIAFVLPNILRQRLAAMSSALLFPVFARLKDDAAGTRAAYTRVVRVQLFVGVPTMLGLALLSEPIILLFFGDQWASAVPLMRVLAVAALVTTLMQTLSSVGLARSALRPLATAQLLSIVVIVALGGTLLSQGRGTVAMCWVVLGATVVCAAYQQARVGPALALGVSALWAATAGLVAPALVMAVVVGGAELWLHDGSAWLRLALEVPLGAVTYLATTRTLSPATWTSVVSDGRAAFRRG